MTPSLPGGHGRRFFRFPGRSGRQIDAEIDEELEFHLAEVARQLRDQGWGDNEARVEAMRRFGDVRYTRQYCRDQDVRREMEKRRMTFVDELAQDFRYAFRSLRTAPGFAATALLTLAIGIGANTAIFSVVRGVLLEPLPFRAPEELVRVYHARPADGIDRGAVSEPDFLEWRAESRSASSMGAFFFADGLIGLDLTGRGDPERISVSLVTDGFFQTLGATPLLGRALVPEEHVTGSDRAIVMSYGLWTRRFGADPAIVGGTVSLNGQPFRVVGIMPAEFTYPSTRAIDGWIPLSYFGPDQIGRGRGVHFLSVLARRAPGASDAQLAAEISGIAARQERAHPDNPGWVAATTQGLRETIVGGVRRPLVVLMVAVGLLLLMACVNIGSLLLARATHRQQELAVRAALGAGRGRITRQLLTESLTLAVLGGALGVIVGVVAVRALAQIGARELPRAGEIRVDAVVIAFTLAVAVLSGVLFGVVPAARASARALAQTLRSGTRGSVGSAGQRLRSGLVVVEVALASILVVGAGLATKSFARLLAVEPGFDVENALVVQLSVPSAIESHDARLVFVQQILDAIRAVPGVRAAGSARDIPMGGTGEGVRVRAPEQPSDPGSGTRAQLHHISTDYFRALGTPLVSGRSFESTDGPSAPPVVMVNQALANQLWPGEPADRVAGRTLYLGETAIPIVGVVGDIRQAGLAEAPEAAMYIHVLQNFRSRLSIVARTEGDPLQLADEVRRAIWNVQPNQTITRVSTLEADLGGDVARPRLLAWLLALFGVVALVLGALGIYGVLAYAVNQRRQEIGVRVALGATPRTVLRLIVGHGMLLALVGLTAGMAGALLLTRSMQAVLYDIQATDAATFVQVGAILLGAALLASWLPAHRALGIDPVSALRQD